MEVIVGALLSAGGQVTSIGLQDGFKRTSVSIWEQVFFVGVRVNIQVPIRWLMINI